MQLETKTGPQGHNADGTPQFFRSGRDGDLIVSELHGRYHEQAVRGRLFSGGMTLTSISNATFTTGTLGATCTPIIGLWNPLNTLVNLIVLQSRLQMITTALSTPTGPGGLVWATAVNQGGLTAGSVPLNRFSLSNTGSVAKFFAGAALTGLVGNLTVQEASGHTTYPTNVTAAETAAGFMPAAPGGIDFIDGAWVIPSGGVLALLATTTPVAISAASAILWEEENA